MCVWGGGGHKRSHWLELFGNVQNTLLKYNSCLHHFEVFIRERPAFNTLNTLFSLQDSALVFKL